MHYIIELVEPSEDAKTSVDVVQVLAGSRVPPERVQQLSNDLWGYLNLNLTGKAR